MRRLIVVGAAAAVLAAGPAAWATEHHGGHGGGEGSPAPGDDRYECPANEHAEHFTGAQVFEERYDYETGRKECVVFYTNPLDPENSQYGSWDPGTEDDDPNYSPGDRGQRWGLNEQGPERGQTEADHYMQHDPKCTQEAQDELLARTRASLARFDGVGGIEYARRLGYVFYPIAWKTYHAFNTNLYDDNYEDPYDGQVKQADLVPELPENIVYAMTDDGPKAMGIMFAMGQDEARGQSWKASDDDPANLPKWESSVIDNETLIDPETGGRETCDMVWHAHTDAEGAATSFDPERPTESVPMAHVWGWGLDMFERNVDGSEASAWWLPYRTLPTICGTVDNCL